MAECLIIAWWQGCTERVSPARRAGVSGCPRGRTRQGADARPLTIPASGCLRAADASGTPSPVGLLPGPGCPGRWRRGNIMLGLRCRGFVLHRAGAEQVSDSSGGTVSRFRPPGEREFQVARAGGRVKGRTPAPYQSRRPAASAPRFAGCPRHALRPADRPDAPSLARSVLSPTSCRLILASGCSSALRTPLSDRCLYVFCLM